MKSKIKIRLVTNILVLLLCSACTLQDIKRWGYHIAREYSCENHGPNLPKRQVECMEEGMSFDEYEAARRQEVEGEN